MAAVSSRAWVILIFRVMTFKVPDVIKPGIPRWFLPAAEDGGTPVISLNPLSQLGKRPTDKNSRC